MPNTLYDALFAPHADNDGVFVIDDSGAETTFSGFVRMAAQMAHVLVANGLEPGARVVVQAPKRVETLALYAAAVQAGGVYLPLNTAYTTDEVAYFIGDAQPAVLICDPDKVQDLAPIAARSGAHVLTLGADGSGSLMQAVTKQPEAFATVDRDEDDLAALLYTSGTTGRSKGAMMTHANLLSNARALTDLWRISAADRLIHALPIFHTHGLFVAMNTALLAGVVVRLMQRFDPDLILAELPRSTLMMGVPTFYTRLLADDRLTPDTTANMRLFISGSAPLLAETHVAWTETTGHRILERYGMTETNMITSNPYDGERRAGTVGMPLPGVEVILTDPDTGEATPEGAIGMIEVRGPNVFQGYWQMPEKTAEDLRDNGFFITGDLGVVDAQGYLSIVGRIKDLIISGGYNIYPKEIEDVLNDIEGIRESAVIGIPDADLGEAIVAVIVPDGAGAAQAVIEARLAETLARFKHPRKIVSLPELPRNTMGKVQKTVLRSELAAGSGRRAQDQDPAS